MNGARLHYELQGDGFPVVLLHGGLLDLRMWDGQVGPFSRHFTTLRYDQRGHGQTESPEGQPHAPHEDLRALLDHFSMDRVHLLGHSLGGRIALDFALAFPERCVPPRARRARHQRLSWPARTGARAHARGGGGPRQPGHAEQRGGAATQRVPTLQRVTLPGVGHLPNLESPEDFNRAVLGFLDAKGALEISGRAPP